MEATPPPGSSGSAAEAPRATHMPRRTWGNQLVPFVPIGVAILVAVATKYYYGARTGGHTPDHDMGMPAAATTNPAALKMGDVAPDFTLSDAHENREVTLSKLLEKGPVLFIYYLGYNCPRCVAHLGHIDERQPEFHKLGAQVIAASPNTVTELQDSIGQYGDFTFPLLADEKMNVARAYGLASARGPSHGLFIIDTNRRVQFAEVGSHPFDDDAHIVNVLTEMQKR
jgi:peroxiredoxin